MQLLRPTIYPPYGVLYVDCPWRYRDKKTGGSHTSGSSQKYAGGTLSLDELRKIPIGSLALPNAVLALWATVPLGDEPFILMREWGFTFKTTFFWIKIGRLGMGHYFRGDVEMLLFGIRGKVRPFRMRSQRNYHMHPTLKEHSAKPAWFRTLVEESTFDVTGKRLELFARDRVSGWDATGLELDGFDIRKLRAA